MYSTNKILTPFSVTQASNILHIQPPFFEVKEVIFAIQLYFENCDNKTLLYLVNKKSHG